MDEKTVNLYALYDTVGEQASPPFCASNDRVAARQTIGLLKTVETPDDFILLHVGTYNYRSAEVSGIDNHRRINYSLNKSIDGNYTVVTMEEK